MRHCAIAPILVWLSAASALLLPQWLPESKAAIEALTHDFSRPASGFVDQQAVLQQGKHDRRVNVTLGVMARCPDAEYCENIFDQVFDRVGEMANMELVYIANVNYTEPEFGMTCMHGRDECLANIHQLCVRQAYPDQRVWFQDFISCTNYGADRRIGDEDVARECAKLAHIDWDKDVAPCVTNDGPRLLRESAERSALLGIERSCSILYNERIVCIHDGRWLCDRHDVGDWVARIRKEYQKLND